MAMFKQHGVRQFVADFNPVPELLDLPTFEFAQERVAQSLKDDNILKDLFDLGGEKRVCIGEVRITLAAFCQIRDMWWCARDDAAYNIAPLIPLKYFTTGVTRANGEETIDVEILPGLDDWVPK